MNILSERRRWLGFGLLATMVCWPGISKAAEREMIRDPHFQQGFILLAPQSGKRVTYGELPGFVSGGSKVWDICQWSSKEALSVTQPKASVDGVIRFENSAKRVVVGKPGSDQADLILGVSGSVEYGTRARKQGEPWVHLLLQQTIEKPPALTEINSARLHVEARLLSSKRIENPDYTPSLHAAQFQIFFSVQNLNRESAGYGQYLWFGIPIYDDRQRVVPAFKAQDTGGTKMFIFTPAGDTFTSQSAHDKQWVVIDKDLLPLMQEGLETAWSRGFLKDSKSLKDYRIAGMNLGWEVPGIFDVKMQTRHLSLKVTTN